MNDTLSTPDPVEMTAADFIEQFSALDRAHPDAQLCVYVLGYVASELAPATRAEAIRVAREYIPPPTTEQDESDWDDTGSGPGYHPPGTAWERHDDPSV